MESGAADAAGLLTPPLRTSGADRARSRSRSASHDRQGGSAGVPRDRGASPARRPSAEAARLPTGAPTVTAAARAARAVRRQRQRKVQALRGAVPGAAAPSTALGAIADGSVGPGPAKTSSDNPGGGPGGGGPEVAQGAAGRPPARAQARPRRGSPNPRRVDTRGENEEVAVERARPVNATLSLSPLRWMDSPSREAAPSSAARSDAPWKRENRKGGTKGAARGKSRGGKGRSMGKGKGKSKKAGRGAVTSG